jgi:hypothetical protein
VAEAGLADPSAHTTRTGQEMWARVRSTAFRHKLQTAAMFLQNDDENEKAAKAAIREVMARVRTVPRDVDTLAAPHGGAGGLMSGAVPLVLAGAPGRGGDHPARQGGESFMRVHWVAVPKELRARRVNSWCRCTWASLLGWTFASRTRRRSSGR